VKELQGRSSASVAASPERCFELLADLERYPRWYPQVVRAVEVIERSPEGVPTRARAVLHVSYGPLTRDFDLLLAVRLEPPSKVELVRVPHGGADPERFEVRWQVGGGPRATIDLRLDAALSIPRLLPVGGIGDELANGFVRAAVSEIGSSSSAI
jgi:ribosome-associated toxin RatA of RatAB toxin-antitoxin module